MSDGISASVLSNSGHCGDNDVHGPHLIADMRRCFGVWPDGKGLLVTALEDGHFLDPWPSEPDRFNEGVLDRFNKPEADDHLEDGIQVSYVPEDKPTPAEKVDETIKAAEPDMGQNPSPNAPTWSSLAPEDLDRLGAMITNSVAKGMLMAMEEWRRRNTPFI